MRYFNKLCYVVCFLIMIFSSSPIFSQKNSAIAGTKLDKNEHNIPNNLDECIAELKRSLPKTTLDDFKSKSSEVSYDYHFNLGLWIRNNWIRHGNGNLWGYFTKLGIITTEDMSGIILDSLWKNLHSLPIDLDKQVAACKQEYFYSAAAVYQRRSMLPDIWNKPLSIQNGNIIKLSDFKDRLIVLLLCSNDITSPKAISELNKLCNNFNKNDVVVIGLEDEISVNEDKEFLEKNKSLTFSIFAITHEFMWKIKDDLISPGGIEFPETILIGRDGKMICRFNDWDSDTWNILCSELTKALKVSQKKS